MIDPLKSNGWSSEQRKTTTAYRYPILILQVSSGVFSRDFQLIFFISSNVFKPVSNNVINTADDLT